MAKKYSDDLKLTVVREYQEGKLGIRPLAKKHGIKSKSLVNRWIKIYEKLGADGLKRKRKNKPYSVQFKLDVLSYMKRTGSSETETALHFGITEPTTIGRWKKAILEGKDEGLNKHKGRPSMSNNKKNDKEMTYEQKLERENELLRLEVEYLKKLRAFRMDPTGSLEKHKQQYHSNSKKSSN
ncbi:helix-turn-helix domain-containing protein [Bacillus sp. Marseille-P3661]|uniref:helix-turn-helix domain-containing protein n=1 Tax=Bacillus sp. Marseille-P3661 TaxID=1936234 RepID=UPI000C836A06|nr:helix-turn-helix domain-containing protein [Bacillus sp. Marseille-P3661]